MFTNGRPKTDKAQLPYSVRISIAVETLTINCMGLLGPNIQMTGFLFEDYGLFSFGKCL
jgi:hypothetical protein